MVLVLWKVQLSKQTVWLAAALVVSLFHDLRANLGSNLAAVAAVIYF